MTTVIHHRSDYDGLFCREIARKALPDATFIGWNYGEPAPNISPDETLYLLDISIDELMSHPKLIWIDHHKSAIAKYPSTIPGYRIDGVAACRLAWQYLIMQKLTGDPLPNKEDYLQRKVVEPRALELAGEYDVWDHRGDGSLEFQFGLDAQKNIHWGQLLNIYDHVSYPEAQRLVEEGRSAMQCIATRDAAIMQERSFLVSFEGLHFLALNTAKCNSNTFLAKDVPETGHDALMAFYWNGKTWTFSLYHCLHRKDIDLSKIAVKYGGGGHAGACGFKVDSATFLRIIQEHFLCSQV